MPDVYAAITEVDAGTAARLGDVMELRARDPQQRAMLTSYLSDLELPASARVLEIGCGSGAIARALARWPGVGEVIGVDPSPALLAQARELARGLSSLTFAPADGRALPFAEHTFDAVVVHTVLSHVPGPERVLAEAFRVLRRGGWLAVFDGDYATVTLATGELDPLQVCVGAMIAAYLNDPWIVRRLASIVREVGFEGGRLRSHGYVQIEDPDYLLTIADRGAEALVADGRIGPGLAEALKHEARRRVEAHTFFGHIAYASLVARRPPSPAGGMRRPGAAERI